MKGKTISITLPIPIVEFYEKMAKEKGMSRSAVLVNVIMADHDDRQFKNKGITNVATSDSQTQNP